MAKLPISAVRILCAALEHGESADWSPDTDMAGGLKALVLNRIVVELSLAKQAVCPHCYNICDVRPVGDGTYRLLCEDQTFVEMDALRRWRADGAALAVFLNAGLNLFGSVDERVDGQLWLLGRMQGRGDGFPVWLLIGGHDAAIRLSCLQHFQRRGPAEQGVLISTSPAALATVWPRGNQAVLLEDVLSVSKAEEVNVATNAIWTAAPPGKRRPGQKGAHKKNANDVVTVFWQRVVDGAASRKSCAQEARNIAEIEARRYGDQARGAGAIENLIRADYRRWKESGFHLKKADF